MKKIIFIIIAVLVVAAGAWYFLSIEESVEEEGVFCTQDAKLCPDGSYVGRTGPDCKFALCPVENTNGWKVSAKEAFSFRYPEDLSTKYLEAFDWPPKARILNEPFSCLEAGDETARAGRTEKVSIEDRNYCLTKVTGAAAGSTYTQYAYAFPGNNWTVVLTFSLRFSQCANYDEPDKSYCESEKANLDINDIADRMARTFQFEEPGE